MLPLLLSLLLSFPLSLLFSLFDTYVQRSPTKKKEKFVMKEKKVGYTLEIVTPIKPKRELSQPSLITKKNNNRP